MNPKKLNKQQNRINHIHDLTHKEKYKMITTKKN